MTDEFQNRRARNSRASFHICRTYSILWRDPRWTRRKHEKFKAVRGRCEACPSRARVVHHKHYVPGRAPWDYPDDDLEALCHDCHWRKHNPSPHSNPQQLSLFDREQLGPLFRSP